MSDTEKPESANAPTNTEAEEAVKGGLFAALGEFEGKTSSPEPKAPETPEKAKEEQMDAVTQEEPKKDETATTDASPRLSAKDLRVQRKEPAKAIEKPVVQEAPKEESKDTKPADPKPKEEDEIDLSGFGERERETIELLKFGEGKELADKGVSKKVASYYRDRTALIEKLRSDNFDDEDFNPTESREYKQWAAKNRPPVDVSKLENIRKERWIEDAKERALAEFRKDSEKRDQEFKQYIEEQEREKLRPEVEREVSQFSDSLLSELNPEVTKAYSEQKDWTKVEDSMPIEAPIVRQVLNEYTDKAEVLVSIASGITKLDPRNPTHASLQRFVSSQADHFAKQGPEKTTKGGKKFAHPKDFKDPETQWTFSKDDMVKMLSKAAKMVAEQRISSEKKKFEAMLRAKGLSAEEANAATGDDEGSPSVKPTASGKPSGGGQKGKRGLFGYLS